MFSVVRSVWVKSLLTGDEQRVSFIKFDGISGDDYIVKSDAHEDDGELFYYIRAELKPCIVSSVLGDQILPDDAKTYLLTHQVGESFVGFDISTRARKPEKREAEIAHKRAVAAAEWERICEEKTLVAVLTLKKKLQWIVDEQNKYSADSLHRAMSANLGIVMDNLHVLLRGGANERVDRALDAVKGMNSHCESAFELSVLMTHADAQKLAEDRCAEFGSYYRVLHAISQQKFAELTANGKDTHQEKIWYVTLD